MAETNLNFIMNFVESNSQIDSADKGPDELSREEKLRKKFLDERRKALDKEFKDRADKEEAIQDQLNKDKVALAEEMAKREAKDKLARLKERIDYAATLEDKIAAERALKVAEIQKKAGEALIQGINNMGNNLFNKIKSAGLEYADYVEKLEVGLLGSSKNYKSVVGNLEKVFSMNLFFSLDEAIKSTAKFVEQGISYNVELRSSLDVFSEKMAKTFDALDSTLLRIVRIQQADSTQARLGMESLLTQYLNQNYQNSEYLHGLSDQVTSALLEATSMKTRENSVEFEYGVQKWLGSMSSVGVSDNTILALAQGLGYMGSGDVESLTSNTALQQLMALSASKGSDRSYGDMLLNGIEVNDVSSILTGFYNLVKEISDSGNMVAMNQYAKIFNLSMSDIRSVLNLTAEDISEISKDMKSYQQTLDQVNSELSTSKLLNRTSYSEIYNNVQKNMTTAVGLDMAKSWGTIMAYEAIDQAANIVDMIDLGIEVDPFGVGASTKIKAGSMLRGTTAMVTYAAEWMKNIQGLSSLLAPNLALLNNQDSLRTEQLRGEGLNVVGGDGSSPTSVLSENQVNYVGNSDQSAIYQTVNQSSKSASSEIMNKDIDAEAEKMEKTMKTMAEIGDNVAFIVQLLNIDGIVVRQAPGSASTEKASPITVPSGGSYLSNGGY